MTKRKEYRPMTVGLEMASDRKSWESWNFQENLEKMESIIASDDFQALDDEVKEDLLKYVTWDLYKNNKTKKLIIWEKYALGGILHLLIKAECSII